jgi:hypothetical protein
MTFKNFTLNGASDSFGKRKFGIAIGAARLF